MTLTSALDLVRGLPALHRLGPAQGHHVAPERLRAIVDHGVADGWRFAALLAHPEGDGVRLDHVFMVPGQRQPLLLGLPALREAPSIALACPGASWAEREVHDLHGVRFTDSPDDRPLLDHPDDYAFRHIEGDGVMEIRVGPIHAGIIEPGHFRFSAVGETVLGLEIRLFYVHRGVERLARGLTPAAALVLAERISGSGSVAHALALARAMESALGCTVPPAHALMRSLLLELERFTNHAGDLGNLCAGTALASLLAEGLIIKERLLAASQQLTGSRWLRNLICLGGVRRLPGPAERAATLAVLGEQAVALERVADKLFGTASNLERLTGTGTLSPEHARNLATVGVVARASGLGLDSRADLDFPSPADAEAYRDLVVVTDSAGDVAARARVRVGEARESLRLCRHIDALLTGAAASASAAGPGAATRDSGEGLGWSEGARGELVTWVRLEAGRLGGLRVRSPSRMNWPAIEHAMPGNIVPDFPLINKSFNLSYAGCDL